MHAPSTPPGTLMRAVEIARSAHEGQTDKTGAPYIDHVARVSDSVEGGAARTVAMLHDVVEKGPGWTLDRLRAEGFSDEVLGAVWVLTGRPGEDHLAATRRARKNALAAKVKRADIEDNVAQLKNRSSSTEDDARIAEYFECLALIDGSR